MEPDPKAGRGSRMKKGVPPKCNKCGRDHWPFVKCAEALVDQERRVEVKKRRAAQWEKHPPDGWSEWGDRMPTYNRAGGNLVLSEPPKRESGVIPHPDWDWKEKG